MTLTGFISTGVWIYASHNHRLIDPAMTKHAIRRDTLRQVVVPLLIFLLSIGVGLFNEDLAKFCWILIAPVVMIIH